MSPRERKLAIIVGTLAVLVVGWFIQQSISTSFRERRNKIADLESKISQQRLQAMQSAIASRKRNEYEARSLPSQTASARSQYQRWLLERVQEAEFDKPLVSPVASREEGGTMTRHQFNISGQARLSSVVKLLYEFHRVNTLHRISRLTIRPINDSKYLTVQMSVEALSLNVAPPDGKLPLDPSPRLVGRSLDEYLKPIEERNLFGPPNNPPQIASTSQSVQTNRSTDFSLKATDPDPLDKVVYRLVDSPDPSAKVDPETGRFRWTPKEPGRYEFLVEAMDDGIPARSTQKTITVSVTDPPPPAPPPPARPAFDDAKYTVLTAVLDVSGEGEVWLLVRPKGKTIKLHTGDEFEVGSVKGQVIDIGRDSFSFEADGKLRRLAKGGTLEEASVESTISAEVPAATSDVN